MAQSWESKAIQAAGRRWTEAYKKNDKRGMAKAAAEAARIRATQGYKLNAGVSRSTPVVGNQQKFQDVKTGGTVFGIGAKTAEQRYNPYKRAEDAVKESVKPKPKSQWQNSQRPNSYYSSPSMSLKEKPSTKKVLNEGMKYNIKESPATRGYMGVMNGYVPINLENSYRQQFGNDTVDFMKDTTSYKAGEIAGTVGQYASVYGLGAAAGLGKAVTSLPKVSQMGRFGQGLARSAAFDMTLGTPLNTLNAVSHGYRGEDLAKQVAQMGAIDLALGGAFEIAGAGFRGARQAMANRAASQMPILQPNGSVKVKTVPQGAADAVPPNTLQRFRVGSEANGSVAQRAAAAEQRARIAAEQGPIYRGGARNNASVQNRIKTPTPSNANSESIPAEIANLNWNSETDRLSVIRRVEEAHERGDIDYAKQLLDFYENKFRTAKEVAEASLSDGEKWILTVLHKLDEGLGGPGLEKTADVYSRQFETEYNRIVKDLADYFYNYKPKGVDIASVPSDASGAVMGETYKRFSNNEPWYSEAFKRFGHKPTKQESMEFAIEKINQDILHGGGDWIDPEMVDMAKTIDGISALSRNKNFADLGADTAKTYKSTEELIKEYGSIQRGERVFVNGQDVTRDIKVPRATPSGDTARFARTMAESKVVDDKMVDEIIDGVKHGDFAGTRKTNKVAVDNANRVIDERGMDSAYEAYMTNADLGKTTTSEDVALGTRLVQELQKTGDYSRAMKVSETLSMQLQEAGRTVQAARIIKRLSPDGRINVVTKIKETIEKLNETEVVIPQNLLDDLRNAQSENDIVKAFKNVRIEIYNQVPSNWIDKLNAWRYTAMLGNPKTIIRNEFGNAMFYPVRMIKNYVGAGLEKIFRVRPGQRTKTILTFADRDLVRAARSDVANVIDIMKSGGKYNDLAGQTRMFRELESKVFAGNNSFSRFLEGYRKLVNTALEDGLGKKILIRGDSGWLSSIYTDSLAQYMKSNGYGLEAFKDTLILGRAREYAMQEALKGTYRDANALSSFLSRTSRKLINSDSLASKGVGWLVEGAVPFKKTPANILRRGVEYSPAGIMEGAVRLGAALKKGEGLATALDHLASGITGSGLMAIGYFLAQYGILNGSHGDDKPSQYDNMNGMQDYSANFGNYTYTLDWMSPVSMPIFVGVEAYNQTKDQNMSLSDVLDAMQNITEPVFNMSMLQGINNLMDTGYADGSAEKTLTPLNNTIASFSGQMVPTLFGQVARTIDPVSRRTNSSDAESKTARNVAYNFNKSIVSKIPGVEQTRQPYVDLWGRTQEKKTVGDYAMSAFQNFISPGYISERSDTNVDRQLNSLANQIGGSQGNAVYPRATDGYKIKVDGVEYRMTAVEKTRYAQIRGQTSQSEVIKFFNSAGFRRMDATERKRELGKIYDHAKEVADEDFMRNRR